MRFVAPVSHFYWLEDPGIRHTVLSTLDTRFDRHLAQAENVRSLFIALNDEVFANREVAIGIIGRLGRYHSSFVPIAG